MNFKKILRQYLNQYPFLKQFIKFCIIGGIAAIIHFSILHTFTEWLKIWYIISNTFGFVISAIFNFLANKFWTFRNTLKGREIFKQLSKFTMVLVSGLVINNIIIYLVTEFVGFDYRLSWVFATGVVTFWNFSLNRFWTFRHRPEQSTNLFSENF